EHHDAVDVLLAGRAQRTQAHPVLHPEPQERERPGMQEVAPLHPVAEMYGPLCVEFDHGVRSPPERICPNSTPRSRGGGPAFSGDPVELDSQCWLATFFRDSIYFRPRGDELMRIYRVLLLLTAVGGCAAMAPAPSIKDSALAEHLIGLEKQSWVAWQAR